MIVARACCSALVLVARRGSVPERGQARACASIALGYLGCSCCVAAGRAHLLAHVRARRRRRSGTRSRAPTPLHAFRLTLDDRGDRRAAATRSSASRCALLLVRHHFRGKRLLDALIDLPLAVSPVVVGLALILVYGPQQLVGGWLADHGIQVIFSPARAWCWPRSSCRCRSSCARSCRCSGDRRSSRSRRRHLGAVRLADLPPRHPAGHPLGARATASCSPRPGRSASTARSASCRASSSARPRR